MYSNYLQHYGVPGMKWGVRRANNIVAKKQKQKDYIDPLLRVLDKAIENKKSNRSKSKVEKAAEIAKDVLDVSKTVKYAKQKNEHDESKSMTNRKENSMSKDAKEVNDIRKKKVHEMSNEELKKVNSRQELERKYKQMNPNIVQKGYKYVAAASAAMGVAVTVVNNAKTIRNVGAKVIQKLTNK